MFLTFFLSGVWALLVNENFSHVISGSRDKKVFITELRNPSNSILVCEEFAPVLSLCYNIDQTGVWVCFLLNSLHKTNEQSKKTNQRVLVCSLFDILRVWTAFFVIVSSTKISHPIFYKKCLRDLCYNLVLFGTFFFFGIFFFSFESKQNKSKYRDYITKSKTNFISDHNVELRYKMLETT